MSVPFRNVEVPDRVRDWPFEAIVTAIERGTIGDWATLTRTLAEEPWGEFARAVEDYLGYADEAAVVELLQRRIEAARREVDATDRQAAAARVRAAVDASGLTMGQFARLIGTSRSRLSTYCNGRVTPSAALLMRIQRTAASRVSGTRLPVTRAR